MRSAAADHPEAGEETGGHLSRLRHEPPGPDETDRVTDALIESAAGARSSSGEGRLDPPSWSRVRYCESSEAESLRRKGFAVWQR